MDKCKHKNTVFAEVHDTSSYEFCIDCKQSRAIYADFTLGEWAADEIIANIEEAKKESEANNAKTSR